MPPAPQSYKVPAGDSKAIDAAIASVSRDLGELDIVVANAGTCTHVLSHECTDEQFRATFETNTHFPFFLARACYNNWFPRGTPDSVRKDKRIVLVSSISGLINNTPQQQCAYNASKAALTHLGKSLAGDWAWRGVRVNSISPGYLDTDMSTGSKNGQKWSPEWKARTPVGYFATPDAIAETILFLGSDMASFMTGEFPPRGSPSCLATWLTRLGPVQGPTSSPTGVTPFSERAPQPCAEAARGAVLGWPIPCTQPLPGKTCNEE